MIQYSFESTEDLFVAPTWPDVFLEDTAYALFRPLYEYTSPWRASYDALHLYLHSQARRLGGRHHLMFHFSNLSLISKSYPILHYFLNNPFDTAYGLRTLFLDLERFLVWRFREFKDDPWRDFPLQERTKPKRRVENKDLDVAPVVISEQKRKKLLKKALSKIPWQQQLQKTLESSKDEYHTELIEKALKECPELVSQKTNTDLVHQMFSSPIPELTLTLGDEGYVVADIPVMLGSHFLSKSVYAGWFEQKKFYRILGCYARWDDAKVVIYKSSTVATDMFHSIKEIYQLQSIGNWKKAQVNDEDYFLSLLVESDLPERSFLISEWEINVSHLTILT